MSRVCACVAPVISVMVRATFWIASTVLFLMSDLSRFYCGQVLGPNGGSVMP